MVLEANEVAGKFVRVDDMGDHSTPFLFGCEPFGDYIPPTGIQPLATGRIYCNRVRLLTIVRKDEPPCLKMLWVHQGYAIFLKVLPQMILQSKVHHGTRGRVDTDF